MIDSRMSLHRPVSVRSLGNHRLRVEFEDGVSRVADLSDVAGEGVFEAWNNPAVFAQVSIADTGELVWPGGLDVCSDAIYRETGAV